MRAELNHQAQSRPMTAASDPLLPVSSHQLYPGPAPRRDRWEHVAYAGVPTGRLSEPSFCHWTHLWEPQTSRVGKQ